jgi:hypothetical protein
MDNIRAVSWNIKFMCIRLKTRFTKPFSSCVPNTYKLYILIYYINIVFILQKITLIHWHLYFELNCKIIWLSLDCPFWYFLSTGSELDLQLGSQSSTGNMWKGYQKKLCFGQWQYITEMYPVDAICLLK